MVNLKDKTVITQFIIVQLFITKLANILSDLTSPAVVLILEEAQMYMNHSDIDSGHSGLDGSGNALEMEDCD